jgi:hydroxymethylpyrimidine/phosphomethylpyrimidine kinase
MRKIPKALTIAGSDSGGGAGVQADLKTMTSLGVYGMSAIASITVQNTVGVFGVYDLPPQVVYDQIKVVVEDIGVDSAKTGMLSNAGIVEAVAKAVKDFKIPNLVVDTVMRSKSGDPLLKVADEQALKEKIIPLAVLITPNIPEAESLIGFKIKSLEDVEKACKKLYLDGANAVLLKGGHGEGDKVIDVFYDGSRFEYLISERINTKNTHGTGCTLSAAISSYLAKGYSLLDAVKNAKDYVYNAIKHSLDIGHGHGPLNHMWQFYKSF